MTEPPVPPPSAPPSGGTPSSGPPAAPRRRRGLWASLIVSLALNVFLVGWVASSWVYGSPGVPAARASGNPALFQHRRAIRALSGDERATADRLWRENATELRERARAMRQAHIDLRAAFTADQADAKSLGDAVADVKVKANALFDQINATLIKIAAALPPQARKSYFTAGFPRPRAADRRRAEHGNQ